MRLNKFLARCGVASRRTCDLIISEKRVTVNGRICSTLGITINPEKDIVTFDGKKLELPQDFVYYMLNKPKGYVTTVTDQFNRPTVMELLKGVDTRVFPVGRLDYATEGLLLFTNDGDLSFKLTHPSHSIDKVYNVNVEGRLSASDIDALESGLVIDGYKTTGAKVRILEESEGVTHAEVIINEGRNRQIRKMFELINKDINSLKRVQIGEIKLDKLKRGEFRELTEKELQYLKSVN